MKEKLSKTEVQEEITSLFSKSDFKPEEVRKIKKLAMKHSIKLGDYRKLFCRKCLNPVRGKLSITKTHKTIACGFCGYKNKIKLKS